ncbi:MAG: hypothetical protein KDJ86_18180 [Bauldia sp.]|uniref:hypothetical protein n=1 Tax=Bauldia sp. TaxID=2575872 RepID=UPI001DF5C4EB|nr:hypothetical protein [Bauldia sp.]MCB1497715.1 hypothetical protein [Bauldia sp.]
MKRWLIRIVVILAVVEVVYLAAINVVLNLPATQAYLNQMRPERITYHWERAWSWIPFRVHATGLVLNGQSWAQQFELSAPSASLSFGILPLFAKTIHLYDVVSADVSLRFRPRPNPDLDDTALRPFYPTIEGRDPNSPAEPVPSQTPGWKLVYDLARIDGDNNDVWLGPVRMTLAGEATASVAKQNLNGPLEVNDGSADVAIKTLTIAGRTVTETGSIKGTFNVASYLPQDNRGFKLLAFLSLDADIDLPVDDLAFLDILLKRVSGLNLGGKGGVKGHVAFSKGDLRPGTDVEIAAGQVKVDLAPYSVDGDGTVTAKVDEATADTLNANFRFSKLSAYRQPENETLFTGTDLAIEVDRTTRLLPGAIKEKVPRRVAMTIPKVSVPDISVYQRYVPDKWHAQVLGGSGSLDGHAEFAAASLDFDLTLHSEDAEVKLREDSFETGLDFVIKAKGETDDQIARVDITGSHLDLDDSRIKVKESKDSAPWQTHLAIIEGVARFDLPDQSDAGEGFVGFWSLFHDRDLKAMLASVDGELKATLSVSDLNWVNQFFKNPYSLAIYNSAEVSADVKVQSGFLVEGSSVKMPTTDFRVEILDYVATGDGGFDIVVEKGGEDPDMRLDANLSKASFRLQDEKAAVVDDMTLAVVATAKGVSLKDGGSVKSVEMNVPSARITDMAAYNAYLPKSSPVRILGGTADLSAKLDMSEESATGFVKMKTSRVEADVGGDRISGVIALDVPIGGGSAKDKTFIISGSSLALSAVRVVGGLATNDWSGRVDIGKGKVVWRKPMNLDMTGTFQMADARPLASFFDSHRKEQKWLDRILSLKNIRGDATIKVEPKEIVIPYAMAKAEPVEVGVKGIFGPGVRQAMFYARYGNLSGILEVDGSEKRFGLFGAKRKFDDYRPGGPLPGLSSRSGNNRAETPAKKPFSIFKRR